MASNSADDSLSSLIFEQASKELEELVTAGEARACESLLKKFPKLESDHERLLELVYLEYVIRQEQCGLSKIEPMTQTTGYEQGYSVDPEEFILRFPAIADEFRKLVQVDHVMRHPGTTAINDTISSEFFDTQTGEEDFYNDSARQVGDYSLLEIIGRGGMGVVYRAKQNRLERIVALKTIDALASYNPGIVERFRLEAELSAKLQHPNIVPIHEIGMHRGTPFFSMEYVRGGTLASIIRNRPLQPHTAAKLVETLAIAVQYAHEQGVIHRDLKPSNILLEPSQRSEALSLHSHVDFDSEKYESTPSRLEPKIADFGLAKFIATDSQQTRSGAALGTPSYMAPEQADSSFGVVGPTSDVYSLGAILYEVLVGRPPFNAATTLETLHHVIHDEPVSPRKLQPRIPVDLETIALRCLEKQPQRRYRSALELANDLRRFIEGKAIQARSISSFEKAYKWARRNPSLTGLIAATLFAAMGMTWLWWLASSSSLAERAERMKGERIQYDRLISLAQFEYESQNVERCRDLLAQCKPEFRHWEWSYLDKLTRDSTWESPRMALPTTAVAISPDGQFIAGGYGLWGVNQAEEIQVWDIENGTRKWSLQGHPSSVLALDFNRDASMLVSSGTTWGASRTSYGKIIGWNLQDGSKKFSIDNADAHVIRFSRDGETFFVGLSNGIIQRRSSETGEIMQEYRGMTNFVTDLDLNSSGAEIVGASRNGQVRIWNIESAETIHSISGPMDPRQVNWTPDETCIWVGTFSREIRKYEISPTGVELIGVETRSSLPFFGFTPDGQYVVSAAFGDGADMRELNTGKIVRSFRGTSGNVRSLSMDRLGKRVALGYTDGSISVWDLRSGSSDSSWKFSLGARVQAIASHPTKPEFALALSLNDRYIAKSSGVPRIELWNAENMKFKRGVTGFSDWPTTLEYRSDGNQIAGGSLDKTVRVWDLTKKNSSFVLEGHPSEIVKVAYLENPTLLLSLDASGTARVWNLDRKEVEWSWNSEKKEIVASAFCSSRNVLVIASSTDGLTLHDAKSGKQIRSFPARLDIKCMVLSHDKRKLAVGTKSGCIEIWDMEKIAKERGSEPIVVLKGHSSAATSISFSFDDARIVSGSHDESVRLYDVMSGCELMCKNTKEAENIVEFVSDDSQIIRSEYHNLLRWGIENQQNPKFITGSKESDAADASWHSAQIRAATESHNWSAVAFHYSALIEASPENSDFLYYRAHARIALQEWELAESDLNAALQRKESAVYRSYLARIALRSGRLEEYREQCRKIWEVARESNDSWSINTSVWTICLIEEPDIPTSHMLPVMMSAARRNPSLKYDNTLALLLVRAGRCDQAIQLAANAWRKDSTTNMPFDAILIGMSLAKQQIDHATRRGNHQESPIDSTISQGKSTALGWISKAKKQLEKNLPNETNDMLESMIPPLEESIRLPQPPLKLSEREKSPQFWHHYVGRWLDSQETNKKLGQSVSTYYSHKREIDIPLLMRELEQLIDTMPNSTTTEEVAN